MSSRITFPPPQLQIDFARSLKRLRSVCLQDALLETVKGMDITTVDQQLAKFVDSGDLAELAQYGLRGELLFAVPAVLEKNPPLIAYYRLLLGYSQKEFYGKDKGFNVGQFKRMEEKGIVGSKLVEDLPNLSLAFCRAASYLLKGLGSTRVSRDLLDDLTLLTIGPQLRGGANNKRGVQGIDEVFDIIREIVEHADVSIQPGSIRIRSAAGREILIEFSADPDLIIREEMGSGHHRNILAIEIKSGTDVSNVHNRLGEAEKSHQKARKRGYTECWTITNVTRLDLKLAEAESPSTDRFYSLRELTRREGDEYEDFRRRVVSLSGIRHQHKSRRSKRKSEPQ